MNTTICPQCQSEVQEAVERCIQCGAALPENRSANAKRELRELLDRPLVIIVLLLHVGLLGIPAYWKTKYSLGVRLLIVAASIVYTIVAVIFIVRASQWLIQTVTGG